MNKKQKIAGWIALAVAIISAYQSTFISYGGRRQPDGLYFAIIVLFAYAGLFFLLKDYKKPGPPPGPGSPN